MIGHDTSPGPREDNRTDLVDRVASGRGDVLVAVIHRVVPGVAVDPAAIDTTATQQRSWAELMSLGVDSSDPDDRSRGDTQRLHAADRRREP